MIDKIIKTQFKLIKIISKGNTCEIYQAISIKDGKSYAIKLHTNQSDLVLRQATILLRIQQQNQLIIDYGLPFCYQAGRQSNIVFAVQDLLGQNLQKKLFDCGGLFRIKTFLIVADQMIKRIQYLHRSHHIHRRISLSKFVTGNNKKRKQIYLVGFTAGKRFQKDNEHIPYSQKHKLKGNLEYQSINAHLGVELSRRDDLQSMIYCWAKMLYGKLPWGGQKELDRIVSKKIENRPQLLFKNLPMQIGKIHQMILNLTFNQTPAYDEMRLLLQQVFEYYQLQYDYNYDWDNIGKQIEVEEQ